MVRYLNGIVTTNLKSDYMTVPQYLLRNKPKPKNNYKGEPYDKNKCSLCGNDFGIYLFRDEQTGKRICHACYGNQIR